MNRKYIARLQRNVEGEGGSFKSVNMGVTDVVTYCKGNVEIQLTITHYEFEIITFENGEEVDLDWYGYADEAETAFIDKCLKL